jgi:hypothetical protein
MHHQFRPADSKGFKEGISPIHAQGGQIVFPVVKLFTGYRHYSCISHANCKNVVTLTDIPNWYFNFAAYSVPDRVTVCWQTDEGEFANSVCFNGNGRIDFGDVFSFS